MDFCRKVRSRHGLPEEPCSRPGQCPYWRGDRGTAHGHDRPCSAVYGEGALPLYRWSGYGNYPRGERGKGLGTTLDVILYDGTLSVGDEIAVAKQDGIVVTKVRALLQPRPLQEILVEDRFCRVKSVVAAAGIKVSAPNLEGAIAGSPIQVVRGDADSVIERIRKEMETINVHLSPEGVIIKADTIGGARSPLQGTRGEGDRSHASRGGSCEPSRSRRGNDHQKPVLQGIARFLYPPCSRMLQRWQRMP